MKLKSAILSIAVALILLGLSFPTVRADENKAEVNLKVNMKIINLAISTCILAMGLFVCSIYDDAGTTKLVKEVLTMAASTLTRGEKGSGA